MVRGRYTACQRGFPYRRLQVSMSGPGEDVRGREVRARLLARSRLDEISAGRAYAQRPYALRWRGPNKKTAPSMRHGAVVLPAQERETHPPPKDMTEPSPDV